MEDVYDLKVHLLGLTGEETDELDEYDIDLLLFDKYSIDETSFYILINDLLPLCTMANSDLTNTWYRGFGADGLWLVKQEVK